MKRFLTLVVLLSLAVFCMAQNRLKVMVIFAHPDEGEIYAGWIVREASALLVQDHLPVFIYMRDFHTTSFSYIPDFAIDIDDVWETKLAACGAHESQVIEYNPEMEGVLEEVLASKKKQADFLFHNAVPFSIVRPDNRLALEKWYGREWAKDVRFVEEFEMAEYGRQINEKDVMTLFPMIGSAFKVPAKAGKSRSPNPEDYTWVLMRIALLIMKAYSGSG